MTTVGRAALLLVLTACGGRVGQTERQGAGATDAGGNDQTTDGGALAENPPGLAGAATDAAAGTDAVPEAASGGSPDGGTGSGGSKPELIGSGTRYCESELYCFGLSCYAPPELEQRVCVAGCQSDDDCGLHEVCLQSPDLDPGCYRACETPFDCEYGFDCFDFANLGQMLVCFPTPWARSWRR